MQASIGPDEQRIDGEAREKGPTDPAAPARASRAGRNSAQCSMSVDRQSVPLARIMCERPYSLDLAHSRTLPQTVATKRANTSTSSPIWWAKPRVQTISVTELPPVLTGHRL